MNLCLYTGADSRLRCSSLGRAWGSHRHAIFPPTGFHVIALLGLLLTSTALLASSPGALMEPEQRRAAQGGGAVPGLFFWQAILPYGSERPSEPAPQALSEITSFLRTMDAWQGIASQARAERPRWLAMRQDLSSQTLPQWLSSEADYFHREYQGQAQLRFAGRWPEERRHSRYQLNILPPGTTTPVSAVQLGDLDGEIDFKPGTHDAQGVLLESQLSLQLATMLPREMLSSIEAFHRMLERPELTQAEPARAQVDLRYGGEPGSSTQSLVQEPSGQWQLSDQTLMAQLQRSIPRSLSALTRISTFTDLIQPLHSAHHGRLTHLRHRQVFDLEKLKQHYPDTYDDLSHILKRTSFQMDFSRKQGGHFARMGFDADSQTFYGDVLLKGGALVLFDEHGTIQPERIQPTQLQGLDYQINTHIKVSLFGLNIAIRNVLIEARFDSDLASLTAQTGQSGKRVPGQARIAMRMHQQPEVAVTGAFLYFLPGWLIDLLIPGSIEAVIADSFDDLVEGNHGQGLRMAFTFKEQFNEQQGTLADLTHVLHLDAAMELPYATLQEILVLDPETRGHNEQRLYATLRQSIRQDFAERASKHVQQGTAQYLEAWLP